MSKNRLAYCDEGCVHAQKVIVTGTQPRLRHLELLASNSLQWPSTWILFGSLDVQDFGSKGIIESATQEQASAHMALSHLIGAAYAIRFRTTEDAFRLFVKLVHVESLPKQDLSKFYPSYITLNDPAG
jgi:hypothetical protein